MFRAVKLLLVLGLGLVALGWRLIVGLLSLMPDSDKDSSGWVHRSEVPSAPEGAAYTSDGKAIID